MMPLQGVRVLELCSWVAGPYCSRLLADMGAEVVKVEPPHCGDPTRHRGPFYKDIPHPDGSLLFLYLNFNKQSITLDLHKPTGRRLFQDLVRQADVLLHDWQPGAAQSVGLDPQALHAIKDTLLIITITPFGSSGPHRDYRVHYLNTYHAGGDGYWLPSGQLVDQMYPEREPIMVGGYQGEYQAGIAAATATMAGLMARGLDGQGRHIDLSKQEAMINLNAADFSLYANEGLQETRYNRYFPHYIGGMFRCKDGFWVYLINSERSWEALVEFMGQPEWARDPRFQTHDERVQHRREIEDHIEAWAMSLSRDELYHGLQQRGCPTGPIYSPTEVVSDPDLRERGFWVETEHPHVGQFQMPSTPAVFSRTPWSLRRPTPSLGQHNQEVFGGWLGLQPEELVRLRQGGII